MADIKFDLDGHEGRRIKRLMQRMAGRNLRHALDVFGSYKVSRIARSFGRGRISSPGQPPGTRTGQARHSVTHETGRRSLIVGTNLPYLGFLHFGGVIRPVRAKALTVPIADDAQGKRARDFDNTFLLIRPRGETVGYIMQKVGKEIRPLFVLRSSVTIKPRPWLFWDRRDKHKLLGIVRREWEKPAA